MSRPEQLQSDSEWFARMRPWSPQMPSMPLGRICEEPGPSPVALASSRLIATFQANDGQGEGADYPEVAHARQLLPCGTVRPAHLEELVEILSLDPEDQQLEAQLVTRAAHRRPPMPGDAFVETGEQQEAWLMLDGGRWLTLDREWQLHLGLRLLPRGILTLEGPRHAAAAEVRAEDATGAMMLTQLISQLLGDRSSALTEAESRALCGGLAGQLLRNLDQAKQDGKTFSEGFSFAGAEPWIARFHTEVMRPSFGKLWRGQDHGASEAIERALRQAEERLERERKEQGLAF